MATPTITRIAPLTVGSASRPSFDLQTPGAVVISGSADPGTTIRVQLDGVEAPTFFASATASQTGSWSILPQSSSSGPFPSSGLHSFAVSSYASATATTPLQTSAPIVVRIGTADPDTLQGPGLGSSVTGPTYVFGYGGNDRITAYTVANDASGHHVTGAVISIDGGYQNVLTGPYTSDDVSVDTVVIPIALSDGTTAITGHPYAKTLTLTTPDATLNLQGIEKLAFADVTVTVQGGVLNDFLYYDSRYHDLAVADVNAAAHYEASGWREGRDPNALFSTTGYLASNADVAAAGTNPLTHYDTAGWKEGRDPSAAFDTSLYLLFNPDVARAGVDPLAQYLATGLAEGRKMSPVVDSAHLSATGFDPTYYRLANPDVARAGVDAFTHYATTGRYEGRDANAFLDTSWYLAANPDVAAAGVDPLTHYMTTGWREGRDPSTHFDTSAYLAANADVAAAGINPLLHFLQSGITEGRSAQGDLF